MPWSPFQAFSERRSGWSGRYGRKGCACAYCCSAGREISSMEIAKAAEGPLFELCILLKI